MKRFRYAQQYLNPNYEVISDEKLNVESYLEVFPGYSTFVFVCFIFFTAKSGGLSTRTLLNSPDNYGNVCLHLAIKHGHKEVRMQYYEITHSLSSTLISRGLPFLHL